MDGKIYTGCTNDIEDRIKRHNMGQVDATKNRLPVQLITYIAFSDKYKAYDFERYLKKGSGRAFSKRHLYVTSPACRKACERRDMKRGCGCG